MRSFVILLHCDWLQHSWHIINCLITAIARAMDEWERRKEEGEVTTDQEKEEDNIYAVSKDNEVQI